MIIVEKGSAKPKLVRRKLKYGSYELVNERGVVFAVAHMTGTSRDNYPWDWQIADGVEYTNEAPSRKRGGVAETLTAVIDTVASAAVQYGLQTAGFTINALAPVVEPSRVYPGKIDIIVKHSPKTSNRLTVSRDELRIIEMQIARILHP